MKVCAFEAITLDSNLAYIDPLKCRLCRKCGPECPTGAIVEVGFPPRKEAAPAVAPAVAEGPGLGPGLEPKKTVEQ